ncbi:peptidoglycan editing factor PgeF [Sphingomicrobium sediminis]|uniref:Purine nucleoside phosphorylase n=1 Tax=Sphingomicrobium sediminis TaxID=2950949 RepID=A0A9X2ELY0_9SPHN|nr:peptidoglycan editing factor PgeF [Sphingomicrobium sediminis]MCM8557789.1 peptidoglycan editing factor PgeF [Sphingomicrobium sediminis]
MLDIVTAPALDGVAHGFFGRPGGVSRPPVEGLNCGFGADDDPDAVRANRRLAADAMIEGADIAAPYQVHSPDVAIATEAWPIDARPTADAVATKTPGLLLGIVTADCAPVLLADREAGVVAAAHAGWRGAIGGVTDKAIGAMIMLGAEPRRIDAAIGPCIAQKSYEVGEDFVTPFEQEDPENMRFFREGSTGKPHFDLESYVAARLAGAGVRSVWMAGEDTYAQPDRYFSFRRATHEGAANYGRQISLIGIAPATR